MEKIQFGNGGIPDTGMETRPVVDGNIPAEGVRLLLVRWAGGTIETFWVNDAWLTI